VSNFTIRATLLIYAKTLLISVKTPTAKQNIFLVEQLATLKIRAVFNLTHHYLWQHLGQHFILKD
jgi:hypothetical protein